MRAQLFEVPRRPSEDWSMRRGPHQGLHADRSGRHHSGKLEGLSGAGPVMLLTSRWQVPSSARCASGQEQGRQNRSRIYLSTGAVQVQKLMVDIEVRLKAHWWPVRDQSFPAAPNTRPLKARFVKMRQELPARRSTPKWPGGAAPLLEIAARPAEGASTVNRFRT
jgi:hypothetical protein